MPQSAFLFDDTVRGNVTLGADIPDEEVWEALRTAQADGFVAALPHGLDSRLGERGTTLSGGQRQRLSLARALVRRPRLLVLDDATSAVDPEVEARILAAMRQRGGDSTLLVIAYRKATIALADEVLFLDERPHRRPRHPPGAARPQPRLRHAGQRLRGRGGRAMTVDLDPEELMGLGTSVDSGDEISAIETIRSGLRFSPELGVGFGWTMLLALIGTAGRVVVPISVQQTLDKGVNGPHGVDVAFVAQMAVLAALAIVATGVSSYFMTARLFTASERGLATLRIKAFRHVHDLPLLTQNTEHRGALVSRVTSDVDQVSQFLVFGGVFGIISVGQVLLATVVMLFYSWQLTILVWVCFLPLFLSLRYFQRRLSAAYGVVRRSVGAMLSAISEPVVGRGDRAHLRDRAAHPGAHRRGHLGQPGRRHQGAGADRVLLQPRRGLGRAGQRRRADRRHLARARR